MAMTNTTTNAGKRFTIRSFDTKVNENGANSLPSFGSFKCSNLHRLFPTATQAKALFEVINGYAELIEKTDGELDVKALTEKMMMDKDILKNVGFRFVSGTAADFDADGNYGADGILIVDPEGTVDVAELHAQVLFIISKEVKVDLISTSYLTVILSPNGVTARRDVNGYRTFIATCAPNIEVSLVGRNSSATIATIDEVPASSVGNAQATANAKTTDGKQSEATATTIDNRNIINSILGGVTPTMQEQQKPTTPAPAVHHQEPAAIIRNTDANQNTKLHGMMNDLIAANGLTAKATTSSVKETKTDSSEKTKLLNTTMDSPLVPQQKKEEPQKPEKDQVKESVEVTTEQKREFKLPDFMLVDHLGSVKMNVGKLRNVFQAHDPVRAGRLSSTYKYSKETLITHISNVAYDYATNNDGEKFDKLIADVKACIV